MGQDGPSHATKMEWPLRLQEAYASQNDIGWKQVLLGRLSIHWEAEAGYQQWTETAPDKYKWSGRVIRFGLDCSLQLWKHRNELVHGTDGQPSKLHRNVLEERIRLWFQEFDNISNGNRTDQCSTRESEVLNMPHTSQLAWVERMKFLYPALWKGLVCAQATNGVGYGEWDPGEYPS